jgi:serine/threonine protein kinase
LSEQDGPAAGPGPDETVEQDDSGLIGTVIAGRYRILRRLGEGATAAVFLAEHLKIGRRDAIKVLFGSVAADPEAAARFLRGARNVSAIHHPNVCTIYDFGETHDGIQFLAMEFVPGEALSSLLAREGSVPVDRAIEITRQVAAALQAAHEAGIVHRDLKPGNIMVSRNRDGSDAVKVVDFDIAKGPAEPGAEGSELTRVGYVIGTPEYMSPEQLTGERLDGRSDLYSLGVVLFRMLTGSLPFRGREPQDLMVERLTRAPLRLSEAAPDRRFPPQLQQVLDRALARRPAERQESAAELGRELAAAREPEPPPTIFTPSHRVARWGVKTWAAAGAVVLLVLAGSGLVVHWRGGTADDPPTVVVDHETELEEDAQRENQHATGDPNADPTATPEDDRQPPPGTGAGDPSRPVVVEPPPTVVDVPRPAVRRVDPAVANDILFRQLDALGPPEPPRSRLQAIVDTAEIVWSQSDVATNDRALAAYIAGTARLTLGDARGCVTWLERALRLRPDGPGYRDLLNSCRAGAR